QEQLDGLLVRAAMAHDLEASGYKLDPLKSSLELLKEYQSRVDLARQIEQLAGVKIKPADFTPAQLRDLRARAGLIQQIAQNGYKLDINRYNLTELTDLVRSSEIAKELRTKYSVNVDIATHSLNELEEILRAAQNQHK